ncbi:MAG: hypothetical protein D6712_17415, partial [Chloroflexi bacterium]
MPITSFSYVWPGATWDSKLTEYWQQSRRNLKVGLSMAERSLCFWLELSIRYGFLDLAWKVCQGSEEAKLSEPLRRILYVHRMDIACLVAGWKQELEPYYQRHQWFNPDEIDGFEDGLSRLFDSINQDAPRSLFRESVSVFPDHAEIYEIFATYCERRRFI